MTGKVGEFCYRRPVGILLVVLQQFCLLNIVNVSPVTWCILTEMCLVIFNILHNNSVKCDA